MLLGLIEWLELKLDSNRLIAIYLFAEETRPLLLNNFAISGLYMQRLIDLKQVGKKGPTHRYAHPFLSMMLIEDKCKFLSFFRGSRRRVFLSEKVVWTLTVSKY